MIRVELLTAADEGDVLDFELRNREFFATTIGDRGEDYFAGFADRHRALVDENEAGTSLLFLIRTDDGRLVGRVNVTDIVTDCAGLGYRVGEEHCGRGYARTAVRLALDAAARRGVSRVTAMRTVDNVASGRVLEANGFVEVAGGSPDHLCIAGTRRPTLHYERSLVASTDQGRFHQV